MTKLGSANSPKQVPPRGGLASRQVLTFSSVPVPIYIREVNLLLLHTYDTRGLADDLTLLSDKTGTQNITFFFFCRIQHL